MAGEEINYEEEWQRRLVLIEEMEADIGKLQEDTNVKQEGLVKLREDLIEVEAEKDLFDVELAELVS